MPLLVWSGSDERTSFPGHGIGSLGMPLVPSIAAEMLRRLGSSESCHKPTKVEPTRSLIAQGFPRCPLWPTGICSLRLDAA
jgi:hypothetical protein